MTVEQLDRMTYRQVYSWLYCKYAKKDSGERTIQAWEQQQEQAEKEFAQKPLEQRKAEFWDMCRGFGCKEAEIAAQWEAYLNGET